MKTLPILESAQIYSDAACMNCAFFSEHSYENGSTRRTWFTCNAKPPRRLDSDGLAVWPEVKSTDWCGAWAPNPNDEEAPPVPEKKVTP